MTRHVVTVESFPARRLDSAHAEVAAAYARLVRSAKRAGQDVPAAPQVVVVRTRVISGCGMCDYRHEGLIVGECPKCRVGYVVSRRLLDLEIHADRPTLAGWEFLAVVEPLAGGNLIKQIPGADVADGELLAYRTCDIACDHCKSRRRRAETFVVRADGSDPAIAQGMHKQVGRSCLTAFTGGKSASAIVAALGYEQIVREAGEEGGGGGGFHSPEVWAPVEFLAWVAASVRLDGWISRAAARDESGTLCTADRVVTMLSPPFGPSRSAWVEARKRCEPTEADVSRGLAALEWARGLSGASDYERNLQLVASQEHATRKHSGILASAIAAYAREIGAKVRKDVQYVPSTHVGVVGEKLSPTRATIERVTTIETQYGALHIHSFRTATGAILVWKTGKVQGHEGDLVEISGRVKAHTEFRGEPQTELTRASVDQVTTAANVEGGAA